MEAGVNLKKLTQWFAKYKYAALILLLGVALLLWPGQQEESEAPKEQEAQPAQTEPALEERLEQLLSQVDGAGQVRVILTMKTGTQYIYQTDEALEEQTQGEDTSSARTTTTVMVSTDSAQQAVVAQTICPTYLGAVVLSQGADQPGVRLDLRNAVSSLTGLSADKITVIKMKDYQEESA